MFGDQQSVPGVQFWLGNVRYARSRIAASWLAAPSVVPPYVAHGVTMARLPWRGLDGPGRWARLQVGARLRPRQRSGWPSVCGLAVTMHGDGTVRAALSSLQQHCGRGGMRPRSIASMAVEQKRKRHHRCGDESAQQRSGLQLPLDWRVGARSGFGLVCRRHAPRTALARVD